MVFMTREELICSEGETKAFKASGVVDNPRLESPDRRDYNEAQVGYALFASCPPELQAIMKS